MKKKYISFLFSLNIVLVTKAGNNSTSQGLNEFFAEKNCESKCTFNVPLPNSISSKTITNFPPPSCNTVCADLVIDEGCDLSEQQLTMIFQNMKRLIGGFTMVNTNFGSVKFLAGLESIECYDTDMMFLLNKQLLELGLTNLNTVACPGIHVATNNQMKKLNMPNLKTLIPTEPNSTQVDIYVSSDSSNFCITIEEMKMFMSIDTADVNHIFGKYCDPVINEKTCKTPAAGCVEVIGDVEVKSDFKLETMKDVEVIYGSLTIKGTTLTDFSFLANLKYVATLEHKAAILIENNANLTSVTFPKLKRIRSISTDSIVFKYNNRILADDPSYCYAVRSALNLSDWAPTVNDFSCEVLEKMAKAEAAKKSSRMMFLSGLVLSIPVVLMILFT